MRLTVHQLLEAADTVRGQNARSVVEIWGGDTQPLAGHLLKSVEGFLDDVPATPQTCVGFSIAPHPAPDGA